MLECMVSLYVCVIVEKGRCVWDVGSLQNLSEVGETVVR